MTITQGAGTRSRSDPARKGLARPAASKPSPSPPGRPGARSWTEPRPFVGAIVTAGSVPGTVADGSSVMAGPRPGKDQSSALVAGHGGRPPSEPRAPRRTGGSGASSPFGPAPGGGAS